MTTPSYIIPNLKGEPTFASNLPGFRSLVGPEQWHYYAELMPTISSFLVGHARRGGAPMRPTLVGEAAQTGDWVVTPHYSYIFHSGRLPTSDQAWWFGDQCTVLTTRPMPEPPNAINPLIEKIEQLLAYPMDNRARVLLTLALDIERGKAKAQ